MRTQKGFTLPELLLVVAILSLVATFFIRPFSTFQKEQLLRKETDTAVGILEDARTRTLASINNMPYGVHFETSKVTLFRGTVFSSGAAGNETHLFDRLVAMRAPLFQGGGNDVVFKKRTGETDFYGTVTLYFTDASSASSTITIRQTGLIEAR